MGKNLLSIILLLFIPFVVWSNPDSLRIVDRNYLNEVVIISSKESRNLEKLPLASSSFLSNKLKMYNISFSNELTAKVPNLFMPDYGSKLTSPIYIRGIGSRINSPSVGLYIDNVPYFEKSTYDIDLEEVERLEVLRGPQGTLYGRNTMGGLINIYTRSPFDHTGTRINLSAGAYRNLSAKVSNYSKLSNKLAMVLSGSFWHKGGYFKNITLNEQADRMNDVNGKIKLVYRPSESWQVEYSAAFLHSKQYGYAYGIIDEATNRVGPVTYNEPSSYTQLLTTHGLQVRRISDKVLFSSTTAFQWLDDSQKVDQDFTADSVYFVVQDHEQSMVSQELTLRSNRMASNYQWLLGAFGFLQVSDTRTGMDYHRLNYSTFKPVSDRTKGAAVYHQSTLSNIPIRNLSIGAGIRFDIESSTMEYKAYKTQANVTTLTEAFDSELNFVELVPKVNLLYQYRMHRWYSSVAKGYKTGGFNTAFELEEDRSFDPENSINYEFGYRVTSRDKVFTADVCLFYIDWKNQQIYRTNPSGKGSILKNAGQSESKGVEASINLQVLRDLFFDVQYGYTHATFKQNSTNDNVSYAGNFIPYVPRNTLSITGNYTFACRGWFNRITLVGQYNGLGSLYWEEANINKQDYYSTLNARVALSANKYTLSFWGRNLSNTYYKSFHFNMGNTRFGQQGRPLTVGVDLIYYL